MFKRSHKFVWFCRYDEVQTICNNNKKLIAMIIKGWRMPQHPKVPVHFYPLMLDCWHPERTERPSFAHLAEHFELLAQAGTLKLTKENALLNMISGGTIGRKSGAGAAMVASGTLVDGKGKPLPEYEASGYAYEPRSAADAWLDAEDLMAEWLAKQGASNALPFSSKSIKMVRAALELPPGQKIGIGVLNNGRHNYIPGMHPQGLAAVSGKIKPFDSLVSINEIDLQPLSRKQCIAALNEITGETNQIVLTLRRDPKLWKDAEDAEAKEKKAPSKPELYDS